MNTDRPDPSIVMVAERGQHRLDELGAAQRHHVELVHEQGEQAVPAEADGEGEPRQRQVIPHRGYSTTGQE